MDNKTISGAPWLCRNNHVLGVSRRVDMRDDERKWKIDVLYKLRESLEIYNDCLVELSVPENDVDCRIEGTVHDIRCSVCGEKRTWWLGKQALNRLLMKMGTQCVED